MHRHRDGAFPDGGPRAGQPQRPQLPCPSGPATQRCTVPTGFSGVPPPGPATPVIPTPTSAPNRARAPSARATATSGLTAPCSASDLGRDVEQLLLGRVRVGGHPAQHPGRRPGPLGQPGGQQTAGAGLRRWRRSAPRSANPSATRSSSVGPVENSVAGEGPRRAAPRAGRRRAAPSGANRVTISSSPSRRQVVISSPASSASCVAQDDGQLRLERAPEPDGLLPQLGGAGERAPRRARPRPRPATCPAAPPAGPGRTSTVGPSAPSAGGHDEARRRARPAPGPWRRTGPAPASGHRPPSPPGRPASRAAPSAARRSPRSAAPAPGRPPTGAPGTSPTTSAVRSSAVGPESART